MKKNFDHCLEMLLHHEGGFTADKFDPGNNGDGFGNQGSTNMGITAKTYAAYTGDYTRIFSGRDCPRICTR